VYEDDGIAGDRSMKHYKLIYEKHEFREIWLEAGSEQQAEELFEENYTKYDDESDEADVDLASMNILEITEIDENGNEI
jgi:hypothetical protein